MFFETAISPLATKINNCRDNKAEDEIQEHEFLIVPSHAAKNEESADNSKHPDN